MKHVGVAAVIAIVVLGVGGALTYQRWPSSSDVRILGKPTLEPQIMSAGKDVSPTPQQQPTVLPPTREPGETRTAMIDRLSKGTPTEQLAAYRELRPCQLARQWDASKAPNAAEERVKQGVASTTEACAGILGGQETEAMPLLARAAEGKAPGAMRDVIYARGALPEVEYQNLFARAIDVNAAAGDEWATALKAMEHNAAVLKSGHREPTMTPEQWLAGNGARK